MKLLDVAAGIVAAKHAGSPCVTISADRVLFLQELRVGDVVHLSSAVNRSWGSSCEIGVRVMRESPDMPPGVQSYCCHAYFTFVAKPVPNPPPSTLARLSHALGITTLPPATRKFQLPELVPSSTLETKRFLLAGRRRAHRLQRAKQNDALLSSMRDEVLRIEKEVHASERVREEEHVSSDAILALQTEVMVEAYMRQDPDVKVVGNEIVAEIEGFMDPVRLSRDLVEKASREKGLGGYRRLSVPETDSFAANTPATLQAKRLADLESPLELKDTLVLGLWIVRPQHANSKHVLFGGCLMRWAEEMAAMCSRRVLPTASWSSASIDALTFRSAVLPGEVVYIRAVVTKVWDSSIEVFIVAQAEDRNSPKPTMRLVSESFFSLVSRALSFTFDCSFRILTISHSPNSDRRRSRQWSTAQRRTTTSLRARIRTGTNPCRHSRPTSRESLARQTDLATVSPCPFALAHALGD